MKILIVEDNQESANLLISLLNHAGYEVTHTSSGLEGLALARRNKFSAVLLDFALPDLDGSQVGLVLRSTLKTTPLIAVTSSDDKTTRKKAERFGFDAFIAKPIDIPELLKKLQSLTGNTLLI